MLIRLHRALDRLRRREAGVTLTELIVYMGVASLVLIMAGTLYVNSAMTTKNAVDRRSSSAEAQNMLDIMSADIRAATNVPVTSTQTTWAVLSATPSSFTFITYTDAGPTFGQPFQVSLAVDASGRLVLSQWSPPASGSTTFPRTGTPNVVRYVGSTLASSAIFSYSALQTNADGSTTTVPVNASPSMAASDYQNVDAVTITLTVQAGGSSVPVTITNTVWMPNAGSTTAYAGAN